MKVVLSHDWILGNRGGERVLEVLCESFPGAPVFTLFHDPSVSSPKINRHPITTSCLQLIPGVSRRRRGREPLHRYLLPLFPLAVEWFRPPVADIAISTSHCVAKGIRLREGTKHLCYCFTPMRYAWVCPQHYFGTGFLKRIVAPPLLAWLRHWDVVSSARVDRFVAISRCVRDRIRRFYGREADVVYPPVDTERFTPAPPASPTYDLVVSGLAPLKRIDLAVSAYSKTRFPLKVVGVGMEMGRLRARASSNVEFLGWVSDEQVLELYRGCRFFLFPGIDDFGLAPVEAQACGRPVVAFARDGACETVKEGVSGVFFHEQTPEALAQAVEKAAATTWSCETIRARAERFGVERFRRELLICIQKCLDGETSPFAGQPSERDQTTRNTGAPRR